MCTGSGVIAIVLARELGAAHVTAVDISAAALLIAARNICKFGLENTVVPVCSDLFTALRPNENYEIIVANPPYIAEGDIAALQAEVRDWEPFLALAGGVEGMNAIAQIVDLAHHHLVPGGWLFMEIGFDQAEKVARLFVGHASLEYDHVGVQSDWSGRPRLLRARRRGKL
jgi:release factor glutamine methyltransferase